MRPRTLAALFLVVAGLLAFIWFYERELPSSDERLELAKRVLSVEADDVRGLTLGRAQAVVRLERVQETAAAEDGDAGWRLREPLEAKADSIAVERLLDELTTLEKQRTLEDVDPAALGLAEPRGRVTLETAAGLVELLIGSEVAASSSMVVGTADTVDAWVVANDLWRDLEKPAGDWRSRDLGPGSREEIQRVALAAGGEPGATFALGRRGDSFWVESPYVDRADGDLVNDLLGEITGLRVESFVDDPPSEPALEAGAIEVVLEGREQALRIDLGAPVGEDEELRTARVGGQLVEIRTRLATALSRAAEEWRSRSWASRQVYEIDRLEVRGASGETLFERQGGDWLRDGVRVEYEPVSELLYALTGIEAESVTPDPPVGEPALTLVLSGDEQDSAETLSLYRANEVGSSPARVEGREVTLLLGEGAVADLELKLAEARTAAEPSSEEEELEPVTEDL